MYPLRVGLCVFVQPLPPSPGVQVSAANLMFDIVLIISLPHTHTHTHTRKEKRYLKKKQMNKLYTVGTW